MRSFNCQEFKTGLTMDDTYRPEEWMADLVDQFLETQEPGSEYGSYVYGFEKLIVWNRALDLVEFIYKETDKFPGGEKFTLTSQIRRASISIPSNIAEGSGRVGGKERCRFLHFAYSSAIELLNHTIIAHRLHYFEKTPYLEIRRQIQEITAMLNALERKWSS
jgi:four helix bundle protein